MRHPLPDLLVLRPDENEKIDTETGFTEGIFRCGYGNQWTFTAA